MVTCSILSPRVTMLRRPWATKVIETCPAVRWITFINYRFWYAHQEFIIYIKSGQKNVLLLTQPVLHFSCLSSPCNPFANCLFISNIYVLLHCLSIHLDKIEMGVHSAKFYTGMLGEKGPHILLEFQSWKGHFMNECNHCITFFEMNYHIFHSICIDMNNSLQ